MTSTAAVRPTDTDPGQPVWHQRPAWPAGEFTARHAVRVAVADPLTMTVRADGRPGHTELELRGELDMGNAARLLDAVAWLRRRGRGVVVVDTRKLTFLDVVGYRALRQALTTVDSEQQCGVVHRLGPAVLRLERYLGP
jgi:anti-anti-sigma factor